MIRPAEVPLDIRAFAFGEMAAAMDILAADHFFPEDERECFRLSASYWRDRQTAAMENQAAARDAEKVQAHLLIEFALENGLMPPMVPDQSEAVPQKKRNPMTWLYWLMAGAVAGVVVVWVITQF